MVRNIRIALAKRAHAKALAAKTAYLKTREGWSVVVQLGYDRAELIAARKLAALIGAQCMRAW